MEKVQVGAVSYLNTKPLIYGFEQGMMRDEVNIVYDYPSNIAQKLIDDEIDVALLPVASLLALKNYYIISDYCIASDGEVGSVGVFSNVPLEEVETIFLDYQSRTSVQLLKILLKEYWKLFPVLKDSSEGYEDKVDGTTACLIIGDRALQVYDKYPYFYDLGKAWKDFTGLPFVYAAWVSNKVLSDDFIVNFNAMNANGFKNISTVIKENTQEGIDLEDYYHYKIKYSLNDDMKHAIALFLNKLNSL